jgi:hypothetical protein
MPRLILNAAEMERFLQLNEPLDLCDPSGRLRARVTPVVDLTEWEPVGPDISEEELDTRERSVGKTYTLEEVFELMRKRGVL